MGVMGWWMAVWWILGLAVMVLLVWIVARAAAGPVERADDSPEQILKRRYARGEIDREEYDRRLTDIRR
jgi:putative membrane protein